jgi:hypothetical protein
MVGPTSRGRRRELRAEIQAVLTLLKHPAGFDINLYGDLLTVRSTDQGTYEVEWDPDYIPLGANANSFGYRSFKCPLRAAATFVYYRHAWKLGEDYVAEACREACDGRSNSN